MAIERADYTHAAGSFRPTLPDPVVTQAGFDSFTRNGVGDYTAVCTERIAFGECVVIVQAGPNELIVAGGQVIAPGTVEIRSYDTFGNPADCALLLIEIKQVTTGPALDGVLPAPPVPIVPPAPPVLSVFGRIGNVIAMLGDYTSSLVTNLSDVVGATVTDALNALLAAVGVAGYVAQFSAADYYASAVPNPAAGQTLLTVAGMVDLQTATDTQTILSCLGDGTTSSGFDLRIMGGAGTVQLRLFYSLGITSLNGSIPLPYVGRPMLAVVQVDTSGANLDYAVRINGCEVFSGSIAGGGGALPVGGGPENLKIGIVGNLNPPLTEATTMRIFGTGYRVGALLSSAQHAAWFLACRAANQFVDAPLPLDLGWSADSDPGTVWAPFVGAGDMAEVGAVAWAEESPMMWL